MTSPSPLTALTLAAMSLPALSATQPVESTASFGASNYQETDIPRHLVIGGDTRRYDVDIRQFRLLTPVGRRWSMGVGVSQEAMSGASPWATVLGSDGSPELIMSGATIRDSRTEVNVSAAHYAENRSTSLTLSQSSEDDYEADAVAVSGEWTFNGDLTTLSLGASYSSDTIEPVDAALFGRVRREERRTRSVSVGVAQVLNRASALYTGLSLTNHDGYNSDPYKLRDVRPNQRRERAMSVRYRRYLDRPGAALHLDYRYFDDNWGIGSHTLHTSWYQNVSTVVQLAPNVRYYSQSEADFYRPFDNFALPLDVSQSSDFRLSGYGAITYGLKAIIQQPGWTLTLSADRYVGRAAYGLESGIEHPARLEFALLSAAIDIRF